MWKGDQAPTGPAASIRCFRRTILCGKPETEGLRGRTLFRCFRRTILCGKLPETCRLFMPMEKVSVEQYCVERRGGRCHEQDGHVSVEQYCVESELADEGLQYKIPVFP